MVTGFLDCEASSRRGGLGFESRPEDRASCLFFSCFFSKSLTTIVERYTMQYGRILPHAVQIVIHSYLNEWHYVAGGGGDREIKGI
jgi:hypothetical protein